MTKKEIEFFAVFVNLIILLLFLPLLTADAGLTALRMQAYTVDENDYVYLLANQQIRIVSPDGKVNMFRSPLNLPDDIDVDGRFIRIYSGNKYMLVNISGTVIEQGSLDKKIEMNKREPIKSGDSIYLCHSFLGFYRITKETGGKTVVRYQMPVADIVLRVIHIIGMISFAAICAGTPLYFTVQKRFAKDGSILPPKTQNAVSRGRFS